MFVIVAVLFRLKFFDGSLPRNLFFVIGLVGLLLSGKGRDARTVKYNMGGVAASYTPTRAAFLRGRGRGAHVGDGGVQSAIELINDVLLVDQSPKGRNCLGFLTSDVRNFAFVP